MLNSEVKPQKMPILETGHVMAIAYDIIRPLIKSLAQNYLRVGVVFDDTM